MHPFVCLFDSVCDAGELGVLSIQLRSHGNGYLSHFIDQLSYLVQMIFLLPHSLLDILVHVITQQICCRFFDAEKAATTATTRRSSACPTIHSRLEREKNAKEKEWGKEQETEEKRLGIENRE